MFANNERPRYEPLFDHNPHIEKSIFSFQPLWHALLVFIWKLIGRTSFFCAQAYHTLYYVVLLVFIFLSARSLYSSEEAGYYAVVIAGSLPVVAAFSTVFYLDVPAMAASMAVFYCLIKRKYLFATIGMIAMYFLKRNVCFLIPAYLLVWAIHNRDFFKRKMLAKSLILTSALGVVFVLDILWRKAHFPSFHVGSLQGVLLKVIRFKDKIALELGLRDFLNSYLLNPLDVVKYVGPIFIAMIFYYILTRKYQKKDWTVLFIAGVYFIFYCLFFGLNSDIRYLVPTLVFLCLIGGVCCLHLRRRFRGFVTAVCILQLVAVSGYVYTQRKIPQEIKEGYTYISKNIPEDATIIYPDYAQMLRNTERLAVWVSVGGSLVKLFWLDDPKIAEKLKKRDLAYLAIKKTRVYDDTHLRHIGAYPVSFANSIDNHEFLELVFDNNEMAIYKIK